MFTLLIMAVECLVAVTGSAFAQSGTGNPIGAWSGPTIGATDGMSALESSPRIQASAGNDVLRHRDFTGRPCLDVVGYAQPHTINPNLYDHVVTALNHCPQRIAIEVCYYQSQDCIPMTVPGDERKEVVIGTMPAEKDFSFEFREKF
jgi:hypothetical protein